jgi:hypothetical protein
MMFRLRWFANGHVCGQLIKLERYREAILNFYRIAEIRCPLSMAAIHKSFISGVTMILVLVKRYDLTNSFTVRRELMEVGFNGTL